MAINTPQKILSFLAGTALCAASTLSAATTPVVGYTSTTLPGGAGNLFAPAFVNSDSFVGTLTGANAGQISTLTVSGNLTANAFNESVDNPGVSKGYPLYYVEVLTDTNASDGLDTEGLIIDVVSNTASSLVVGADISNLGIQGDERIAVRKHLTLGDVFAGSSGLSPYGDPITIYNENGPGTAISHLSDGIGGFVLNADFVTQTTNAPIYPGTGFVINNTSPVTIVPTGVVKESDTQVVIYGGSVVNIISPFKPLGSIDLASDGRLNETLAAYGDPSNTYTTDGTLTPSVGFLNDGAGGFVSSSDFVTQVVVSVDGASQPIVVNASDSKVYKATGVNIP